jgi:hypothetical protein
MATASPNAKAAHCVTKKAPEMRSLPQKKMYLNLLP